MKYSCPYCKSNNIKVENPDEDKKELMKRLNELSEKLSQIGIDFNDKFAIPTDYNLYDDDDYLNRLKERGFSLTCCDCGAVFYENDKFTEKDTAVTPISYEEYMSILIQAIDDCYQGDQNFYDLMKKEIANEKKNLKYYFKEFATKEAEEIYQSRDSIDQFNQQIEEAKEEDNKLIS